jgi:tRNA G10  N-methylase Trm11
MEYFFVLGRNPALSYAEVISYLKSHDISYSISSFENNFLIVSVKDDVKINVQDFGGVLKIGKATLVKTDKDLDGQIENYFALERKFNYSVIGNGNDEKVDYIEESLKQKFKKEKLKAQVKHSSDVIKTQDGDYFEFIKSDVEFFFFEDNNGSFFGLVDQSYSYKELKERDMQKPVRRESLAISPRLAKIMINLSQVRSGDVLLDPFCGIGVIVQEAVLKGINCIGGDIDKLTISGAKRNLDWLETKFKVLGESKFRVGDSSAFPFVKIDGVATEPALGDVVRRKLNARDAPEYIRRFESLIIPVLRRMRELKTKDGKIVLTMPFIRDYSVSVERICGATGLRIYNLDEKVVMPIKESREGQFIGREIVVLE